MTNKIKYLVKVNGITVKSGVARVNNKDFGKFEKKLISETPKKNTDDVVEVFFR